MIPSKVKFILDTIENEGYEAYIVGGAVRDFYLDKEINDWDITTNASPDIIEHLFARTYAVGRAFGTVVVVLDHDLFEVTTYRTESDYHKGRKPQTVAFSSRLEDDLSRRDFTMNAMVMNKEGHIFDYYEGQKSLDHKIIHTVGNARDRFTEDYLRVYRYIRFNAQLGFNKNPELDKIIMEIPFNDHISFERIRLEFDKILLSDHPDLGLRHLRSVGLLSYIIPGIEKTYDFDQHSQFHHLDVFEHLLEVVKNSKKDPIVRLAALLHDIGKPDTFEMIDGDGHFYKHHKHSEDMAKLVLKRLKYSNHIIKHVCNLIHYHMTLVDTESTKSVKKFINKIGADHLDDFVELRKADILGSKDSDDLSSIDDMKDAFKDVLNADHPMTIHDLKVNGYDLMVLGFKGPEIGKVKHHLLEHVLHHHEDNKKEILIEIAKSYRKDTDV